MNQQQQLLIAQITEMLVAEGIELSHWDQYDAEQRHRGSAYYLTKETITINIDDLLCLWPPAKER